MCQQVPGTRCSILLVLTGDSWCKGATPTPPNEKQPCGNIFPRQEVIPGCNRWERGEEEFDEMRKKNRLKLTYQGNSMQIQVTQRLTGKQKIGKMKFQAVLTVSAVLVAANWSQFSSGLYLLLVT